LNEGSFAVVKVITEIAPVLLPSTVSFALLATRNDLGCKVACVPVTVAVF
jgi:hypothetical protein